VRASAKATASTAVVAGVGLIGLLARVAYFTDHRPILFSGVDGTWYSTVGHSFATGHLGTVPALGGGRVVSFRFPPAFPAVLGIGERVLFWMSTLHAQLWTCAVLGAIAASLTAALVWRVSSRATPGVRLVLTAVAGLLIALNPLVIGTTATLMSESLYVPVVAGALLAADHLVTSGSRVAGVTLGAVVAVGALTRSEGIVVLGAIVVAAVFAARVRSGRPALVPGAIALAIGVAAVAGWSAFASVQAGRLVVMSTNGGSLALGANCPLAWGGSGDGYWDSQCEALARHRIRASTRAQTDEVQRYTNAHAFTLGPELSPARQAEVSSAQLGEALARIRAHPLRAAFAVPHRLARGLGLSTSSAQRSSEQFEGRIPWWDTPGRWLFALVILPLALVGTWSVLAHRSRAGAIARGALEPVRLAPALVAVGAWLVVTASTYGSTRFRAAAEPSFAVLATVGGLVVVLGAVHVLSRGERDVPVAA